VLLNVHELSNASSIVSLGDHDHGSNLELDDIASLSGCNVNLDGIIRLDIRIGVTEGTSIVGNSNGNLVRGDVSLHDLAELVGSLFLGKTMKDETSLGIKEKTEDISRLLKFDNVHESSREVMVSANLSVHLDTSLHADLHALLVGEGILEPVTEDDSEGKALALLVGTSSCLGCPDSSHLTETPLLGCVDALEMFLASVWPGMW